MNTIARAINVTIDRSVTKAPRMEARSETKKICLCSRVANPDESPGMLIVGSSLRGGDWVGPPPGVPVKVRAARYFAAPRPMMLMATPDTMWSTPKTTVAIAWIAPPIIPQNMAPSRPAHGP
jgi:hypothetical protein